MLKTKIKELRISAYIEGWSFLILLFVAMSLKYAMSIFIVTKIIGMVHGILFIWFMLALFGAKNEQNLDMVFTLKAFVLSLVPFGTFVLDNSLKPLDKNRAIFDIDKKS